MNELDLSDIFAAALHNAKCERTAGPHIPNEGKIARLREYAERAAQPNPFAPGDLVKLRPGGIHRAEFLNQPYLVLETFPIRLAEGGEVGTPEELRRYDLRVACYDQRSDAVMEKPGASWEFEPWKETK